MYQLCSLVLPSSSLQCEHFFLPLTLRRRSEEPPTDDADPSTPLPPGGLRGGTWGPGSPRMFDEGGGGPGGMSLNLKMKKLNDLQNYWIIDHIRQCWGKPKSKSQYQNTENPT